jgi:hypothetical protein
MLLKVTRDGIPVGITSLTAVLTRSGYDSLSTSLNVLTDTSSQLSFQTVAVGTWNLKIDALNSQSVVVYTGATSVTVAAGMTTQLSVTLNPVLTTGGIQISIIWGTTIQPVWLDYPGNPILTGLNYSYETGGILEPTVLYENGVYKMWFSSLGNSGHGLVDYATSSDGISWTRYPTSVLAPGDSGAWDSGTIGVGPVIKVDNTYRMYYTSWSDQYSNWSIGLATSADGITWTKNSLPVLKGTTGTEFQIVATDIIKFNNKYYLYYTGRNLPYYKLYAAVSDDGLSWTRLSSPILTATEAWEGNGPIYGTVIQDGNVLRMAFMNDGEGSSTGFGFATSTDGITWTKDSGNPFFTNSQTTNHWALTINYPRLVKFGSDYRIYYTANNNGISSIGLIRKI